MGLGDIVRDLTSGAEGRAVSRALKFFSKGQLDKAIETLKEAHEASPENADILFDLSRYLLLAGHGPEAAEALRTVLRRDSRGLRRALEMIEELRAKHAAVSPLYDAVAEHFVRRDDLKSAFEAMERMKPDEIRSFSARHKARWDGLRKNAPDAKMVKTTLHSVYYLALGFEVLRDYGPAADIYRTVAKNNPEEAGRVVDRLEALLAKDHQNAALRAAVGDLCLAAGREDKATQHFALALESDARAAAPVAKTIDARLQAQGDKPALRWLLVQARLASKDSAGAIEAMKPLVAAGALLDEVVPVLERLATASVKDAPAARLLMASAQAHRGHPQAAIETLTAVAEESGLAAIREPLEQILSRHPGLPRAHQLLADVHLKAGRVAEAVASMRRAREGAPGEDSILAARLTQVLEADETSAEAHVLLGDILVKSGELERGVVVLRHLLRLEPARAAEVLAVLEPVARDAADAFPRARIGAAEACLQLGRAADATRHLAALASSHPGLAAEYLRAFVLLAEAAPDQSGALVEALRGLLAKTALPQAALFALGEVAFFGGDLAAAGAALRDVLQAAPQRKDEVRQALERFDRDHPAAVEARCLIATLQIEAGQHAAAVAELVRGGAVSAPLLEPVLLKYQALLDASPDDVEARCGFVDLLFLGHQLDRVLATGQEVLRTRDDETTARVSVAMGDALRGKGDDDAAVKRYFAAWGRNAALSAQVVERLRSIIDGQGGHALASLALGKVLGASSRPAEAVEALQAAVAADPKLAETVLAELLRLRAAAPASPEPGLAALVLLLEARDHARALPVVSALLDAHPALAPVIAGHLERILAGEPGHAFASFEMGRALQHMQLHPRAAAFYLAAFRADAGLAPMALKRLQEMIVVAPGCPDPYLAACAIHTARGKPQAAADKIRQAVEKMPDEAERLVPRLEEIVAQGRSPRLVFLLAQVCALAGKHDKAIAAYIEAGRGDPAILEASLPEIETVLKAQPKMGAAYFARARVHAQALRGDRAAADFDHAVRLSPDLAPAVVTEILALRARVPDAHACAMVLADLYAGAGKEAEAERLLVAERDRGVSRGERLPILVRLWRLAAARRDDEGARAYMDEALRLAPDRGQFLVRVHEACLAALQARARRAATAPAGRKIDVHDALRALVELGDVAGAAAFLERHRGDLEPREAARLLGEIALRRGDYPRAAETLQPAGPSRILAFAAARAGDHALAVKTLESLATQRSDPGIDAALRRVYHVMVEADLLGGRRRLVAETTIEFTAGAA